MRRLNDVEKSDLNPINEIKKEYLEDIDLLGNRSSKASLYKKYNQKYNINRHTFLNILNRAHEEIGSPKRHSFNKKQKNWKNDNRIYSDLPPHRYD